MDHSTITFLIGLISCGIGIATFVGGMNARAAKNGVLEQKIEQAIHGIEEIKAEMQRATSSQNITALQVQAHETKIQNLERKTETDAQLANVLNNILSYMQERRAAVNG